MLLIPIYAHMMATYVCNISLWNSKSILRKLRTILREKGAMGKGLLFCRTR